MADILSWKENWSFHVEMATVPARRMDRWNRTLEQVILAEGRLEERSLDSVAASRNDVILRHTSVYRQRLGFSRDDFITKLPSSRKYLNAFFIFWTLTNNFFILQWRNFVNQLQLTHLIFRQNDFITIEITSRFTKVFERFFIFWWKIINEQFFIPPEILLSYVWKIFFISKYHFKEMKSTFHKIIFVF